MKVGTILLTKSNKYVDDNGNLPKRPRFDKDLLKGLLNVEVVTVSEKAYNMLPPSMQKLVLCLGNDFSIFPITIEELENTSLLIVVRSTEDFEGGKEFRLDNFKQLVKDRRIELWVKKN